MNRDNEFDKWWANEPVSDCDGVDAGHVEAAFAAGRKAEREACAKACESGFGGDAELVGRHCAMRIRKRSNV
jgi:hypothetical protein